jgi:hypothetical protein
MEKKGCPKSSGQPLDFFSAFFGVYCELDNYNAPLSFQKHPRLPVRRPLPIVAGTLLILGFKSGISPVVICRGFFGIKLNGFGIIGYGSAVIFHAFFGKTTGVINMCILC